MVNKINLFDGLNINPIPIEFANALTTTEMLGALQAKVNECVEFANSIQDNLNDYTDEQVKALRAEFNSKFVEVDSAIQTAIANLKAYSDSTLNNGLATLESHIAALKEELTETVHDLDTRLTKEIDDKYLELKGLIDKTGAEVIDPTTGQYDTVENVLQNIYDLFRSGAITAAEFDALMLTCEAFEAKELTCRDFELEGKSLLY